MSSSFSFNLQILSMSVALAGSLLTGCRINSSDTKVQYMPDMVDSPAIKPQAGFINPPDHSVAVNAILYPATDIESAEVLNNPVPANDQNIAEGKVNFEIYCKNCHGVLGDGKGTLGPTYPYPPDVTTEDYKAKKDGFYYYRITFGGNIMPGYGDRLNSEERWQIVHYLRTLQNKG